MRNIKRMFRTGILLVCLGVAKINSAQTISSHFFGENAWMPDTIGSTVLNGKLHKQWQSVKASKAAMIRFGGIAPDKSMPTNYQYIKMIDSIRANGMEPIIQVPFYNQKYTAQQAATIVNYINVVKGRHIKYWIIGNEPNLSYSYTSASQIANYFRPFASAMKNADPSIFIVGPEIAWFDQNIINGLTTPNGSDDITGKDATGKYYLDVISFHTYPFDGNQTRDQVISKLSDPNSLSANLVYLNNRVAACNTAHGRTGTSTLKTAITEANICWKNSSSDDIYGVGANSFIGGQFVAEMLGIGMKNGMDFINLWSVIEGNSSVNNIGYIDPSSNYKKPLYYHFKLLADNFKGNYIDGIDNKPYIKSFGCKDQQQIAVLIMNQDISNSYNYTVRLNSAGISGSSPLKINVDAGIANEYTDVLKSQSTILLVFNLAGAIVKKYEYSLSGNAVANTGPTYTPYIATGVAAESSITVTKDDGSFDVNVFPNPSVGKFTLELNKENSKEKNFEIELINIIGQEVYHKKSIFEDKKEEIILEPSVADGTYILRVKEGDNMVSKKIVLQK
jgi:hypothetical protein